MSYTSNLHVPNSYEKAKAYYEGGRMNKSYRWLEGSKNTAVWKLEGGDHPAYSIKLYQTHIITYYQDGTVALDNYDSRVTNDRRSHAGMPIIRGAHRFSAKKLTARLVCDKRWERRSSDWPYMPFGLPADRDLHLDARGMPVGWETWEEDIYVLRPEAAKARKDLLKWARDVVGPVLDLYDISGTRRVAWDFGVVHLKNLQEAVERDGRQSDTAGAAISDFISTWSVGSARAVDGSFFLFKRELSRFTPAKCVGDNDLYDVKTVKTKDLMEELTQ